MGAFPPKRTVPAGTSASVSAVLSEPVPVMQAPVTQTPVIQAPTPSPPVDEDSKPTATACLPPGSWLAASAPASVAPTSVGCSIQTTSALSAQAETARSAATSAVSFRSTAGQFGSLVPPLPMSHLHLVTDGQGDPARDCESTLHFDDSHAGGLFFNAEMQEETTTSFVLQNSPFPAHAGTAVDELIPNQEMAAQPQLPLPMPWAIGPAGGHPGRQATGSSTVSLGSSTVTQPGDASPGPSTTIGSSTVTIPGEALLPPAGQHFSVSSPSSTAKEEEMILPSGSVTPPPGGGGEAKQLQRRRSSSLRRGSDLAATARALAPRLNDEKLSVPAAAEMVKLRDLRELRSFRNPPAVVIQVFEAVATILSISDPSWVRVKRMLDNGFLGQVQSFDPAKATLSQAERLAVLLQAPAFSDAALAERCPAVVALAAWCNAVGRSLQVSTLQLEAPTPPVPPKAAGARGSPPSRGASQRRSSEELDVEQQPPAAKRRPTPKRSMLSRPDLGGLDVLPDLWSMGQAELSRVRELSVSRKGVGVVTFHGSTDCRSLVTGGRLSQIVVLRPGEVVVYPDQDKKPPVGMGLNKPATITLYGCLPKVKGSWDSNMREKYKNRVKHMTQAKGAELLEYDCDQGVWQFRVQHF